MLYTFVMSSGQEIPTRVSIPPRENASEITETSTAHCDSKVTNAVLKFAGSLDSFNSPALRLLKRVALVIGLDPREAETTFSRRAQLQKYLSIPLAFRIALTIIVALLLFSIAWINDMFIHF